MKSNEEKIDNHNYAELNRSDDKGADFWELLISEFLKSENNDKTNFKNEKNFDDFNFVELQYGRVETFPGAVGPAMALMAPYGQNGPRRPQRPSTAPNGPPRPQRPPIVLCKIKLICNGFLSFIIFIILKFP